MINAQYQIIGHATNRQLTTTDKAIKKENQLEVCNLRLLVSDQTMGRANLRGAMRNNHPHPPAKKKKNDFKQSPVHLLHTQGLPTTLIITCLPPPKKKKKNSNILQ